MPRDFFRYRPLNEKTSKNTESRTWALLQAAVCGASVCTLYPSALITAELHQNISGKSSSPPVYITQSHKVLQLKYLPTSNYD